MFHSSKDEHLLQLEDDLRATLMKISVCDTSLKPNPPGIQKLLTYSF